MLEGGVVADERANPFAEIELDLASPVPVYYQLYEALRSQLGTPSFRAAPG